MKILNLFAGIGGNRTSWGNSHQVVAVEKNQQLALIYQKRFPKDIVIIGDAYDYLAEHFLEFDIIWLSPPCQSHSKLIRFQIQRKFEKGYKDKIKFPDFSLYSVIVFLQEFCKGYWIVENVKPYYKPLIEPSAIVGRHYIWCNFPLRDKKFNLKEYHTGSKDQASSKGLDFDLLKDYPFRKDQVFRNAVHPKISEYIMNQLMKKTKIKQLELC